MEDLLKEYGYNTIEEAMEDLGVSNRANVELILTFDSDAYEDLMFNVMYN